MVFLLSLTYLSFICNVFDFLHFHYYVSMHVFLRIYPIWNLLSFQILYIYDSHPPNLAYFEMLFLQLQLCPKLFILFFWDNNVTYFRPFPIVPQIPKSCSIFRKYLGSTTQLLLHISSELMVSFIIEIKITFKQSPQLGPKI